MGWGLGFDQKLKPFVSGSASIFINTARMSNQTRNAVRRVVESMFLPVYHHGGLVATIFRETGLHKSLPSLVSHVNDIYQRVNLDVRSEIEATLRMYDFNVYVDDTGRIHCTIHGSKEDVVRNKMLKDYEQICARYSVKYLVPKLPPEEAAQRQAVLKAIDTRDYIVTKRTF
jgi:hypothetical protein